MSLKSPLPTQSISYRPNQSSDSGLDLNTSRLNIRWLSLDDAEFVYELVNDLDWIRYIGDKSIANLGDAKCYLKSGPLQMYRNLGHGLNRVALKINDRPIGICGLLKRDSLAQVDLGFAFLAAFRRQGYAYEAARAILQHGSLILGKNPIQAIVNRQNQASIQLLSKLGFDRIPYNGDNSTLLYSYNASSPGIDAFKNESY